MKTLTFSARSLCAAAAFFLSLSQPFSARAQVSSFELEPVTVTGSGMPRSLGSEIAATSVLTRGDIERSGARDAVQVLNLLGTALVEQQGGPGTLASVRIRGADTRDTLVLIDGVPLTDVTSGQASIQQIPADMIERVEVVRGNLSALYGANATGGVIQIFTRRGAPGPSPAEVSFGVGSRGTTWLDASAGAGNATWAARVGVGAEGTDGFSAANTSSAPGANPDRDGNRRHHAMLAMDARPAQGQRISFDVRHTEGAVQYDSTSSFSDPTDTHSAYMLQTATVLHGEHALNENWVFGWRVARSEERRKDSGSTTFGPFEFANHIHNDVNAIELNGMPLQGWHMQAGIEGLSQSTDAPTYTRQRRDTDVMRWGAVHDASWGSVQLNWRHDRTSDFGSATTGLVGGKLTLAPGLSAIANVSSSFTPPGFDFLFYDCAPFPACNNPHLRPERARNVEVGVQWQDARTLARATLFTVRYRDKIANDPNFVPQNLNSVKNQGLEISVRHAMQAWVLVAEGSVQNPVDQSTGERLLRRAREQFALRADFQQASWHAGAGLRHVGDRRDSGNVRLPSYTVVDASAHWKLAPRWSAQARIENLFDHRYEPAFGYNGTPRGIFVGLSWMSQ